MRDGGVARFAAADRHALVRAQAAPVVAPGPRERALRSGRRLSIVRAAFSGTGRRR